MAVTLQLPDRFRRTDSFPGNRTESCRPLALVSVARQGLAWTTEQEIVIRPGFRAGIYEMSSNTTVVNYGEAALRW
jgi:hypothetical protein